MTLGFLRTIYLTRDTFVLDDDEEDDSGNDQSLSLDQPAGENFAAAGLCGTGCVRCKLQSHAAVKKCPFGVGAIAERS